MRTIISKQLKELGFEVFEAENGHSAMARLNEVKNIRLVLLDWNMPEMDGLEVLNLIRAENAYKEIRVMMVTTESEMSRVATALEAGASEYLMKPFDREALLEKLILLGMDPSTRTI
jgi:two-component system chemotaxis response regulator CheY